MNVKNARRSYFYYAALAWSPIRRWVTTAMILFLIFILWWYFSYSSITQSLHLLQADIVQLTQELDLYRHAQQELDALRSVHEDDSAGSASSQSLIIRTIVISALKAGLYVTACFIEKEKKKEWYTRLKIHGEFAGTFKQILKFLRSLTHLAQFVRCTSCTVHKSEQDITCECTISAIFPDVPVSMKYENYTSEKIYCSDPFCLEHENVLACGHLHDLQMKVKIIRQGENVIVAKKDKKSPSTWES